MNFVRRTRLELDRPLCDAHPNGPVDLRLSSDLHGMFVFTCADCGAKAFVPFEKMGWYHDPLPKPPKPTLRLVKE